MKEHYRIFFSEMKVNFTRPLEDIVCVKGSSLTLRCEINKLKGDVQWLKDGQEIPPSRRHTIRAHGRERSFTIHQVSEEDAGEYVCESTDDRTSAAVTVECKYLLIIYQGRSERDYYQYALLKLPNKRCHETNSAECFALSSLHC